MQLKTTPAERADYQRVVAKSYPHSLTCRLVDDVATLEAEVKLLKELLRFPPLLKCQCDRGSIVMCGSCAWIQRRDAALKESEE